MVAALTPTLPITLNTVAAAVAREHTRVALVTTWAVMVACQSEVGEPLLRPLERVAAVAAVAPVALQTVAKMVKPAKTA